MRKLLIAVIILAGVPVTGLPLHLAVRSVSVVPGGVRVSVSASSRAGSG